MFQIRNIIKHSNRRWFSSVPPVNILETLRQRSLIRVSGAEVSNFLQGLITNDIHHLDHGVGNMYTMFLNMKGRVLYDTIIYRTSQENTYLIECDTQVIEPLQKHLRLYRVRRKIDIASLRHEFKVYALFDPSKIERNDKQNDAVSKQLDGLIVPCTSLKETLPETSTICKMYCDLLIYHDPRLSNLGPRIIAPIKSDIPKQISEIFSVNNTPQPEHTYRWFRYNLGVGEGVNDLPPGNCFPLEANCDYLHGVSFHKGCYIGQEVTARTHHTGVVRKRLMPLYFSKVVSDFPKENTILHENVNLGKFRGIEGNVGLGLLRIAKALEFKEITVGDGIAGTEKPSWWPLEAPKERQSAQRVKMMSSDVVPITENNESVKNETEINLEVNEAESPEIKEEKPEIKYFQCSTCILKEKYEYFGKSPPWVKDYKLVEDAYVIEDPFVPPKRGEFLILGAHCVQCSKAVCKDSNCSFYFSGTFCIRCAKERRMEFPKPVQEKLNRIVVPS